MILSFKTKFPCGTPTHFISKIIKCNSISPNKDLTPFNNDQISCKIHTIRDDNSNRWKEGRMIHFATGVRTKDYFCFATGECVSTQTIDIVTKHFINMEGDTTDCFEVYVDGKNLSKTELSLLAINDGFANVDDFKRWFAKGIEGAKIIHWTNFKY